MDGFRFNQALQFALNAHARQKRKGSEIPYVTHVVAVAEWLARLYPQSDGLIIAGLLHDTLEDTGTTPEALKAQFGPEVLHLVEGVTRPAKAGDKLEVVLEHLERATPDVLRLKAADALANLEAIRRDLQTMGSVWERFKGPKEQTLGYYQGLLERFRRDLAKEPICEVLKKTLHSVRELA